MRSTALPTGSLIAVILTAAVPFGALAQTPAAPTPTAPGNATAIARPPNCDLAEHRQFDFWIGDWDVFQPDGTLVGTNHITLILATCVLLENWKGKSGLEGWSFNVYDRVERKWHQTWVDSHGARLELTGTLHGKNMVLTGEKTGADGVRVRDRITWEPINASHVRQLWEQSKDGGKTWMVVFDGKYVRRASTGSESPARRNR